MYQNIKMVAVKDVKGVYRVEIPETEKPRTLLECMDVMSKPLEVRIVSDKRKGHRKNASIASGKGRARSQRISQTQMDKRRNHILKRKSLALFKRLIDLKDHLE